MARHIVTNDNFFKCLDELKLHGIFAIDTETTGLHTYSGAHLFSIIVSSYSSDYYFNFNVLKDHTGDYIPPEYILPRAYISHFRHLLHNPDNLIFMHNAKFDMHMLGVEGLEFKARIMCTMAMATLLNNRLGSYSLASLAPLIDHAKDDTIEKYISKHKLYTDIDVGKKTPRRDKHFDLVPFNLMAQYGLTDARITFDLGMHILSRLETYNNQHKKLGLPELFNVYENELALTKALYKMEKRGALIDRKYVKKAYDHECELYLEAEEKFYVLTGIPFEDSRKVLKQAFENANLEAGRTRLGNASFSDENLPDNEISNLIRARRRHYKRAHTYFKNFLDLADLAGVIHCNYRQNVSTGRMSCYNPNLQNVPKRGEDTSSYPVRACFKPREGFFFAMFDWDQMEYRLLLDRAGEKEVIDRILNQGLDVHEATAKEMGVKREAAKTLNFMLLYGGGAAKLSQALGVNLTRAKELKNKYFQALPKIKSLIRSIINMAKGRKFIVNWYGRRLSLDLEKPYKMPNHYIQGGCGDICKAALVSIDKLLTPYKSALIMQVHDELICEIALDEQHLLDKIKNIMENTYPAMYLPLTAGIEYSMKNWHEKRGYHGEAISSM